PRRNHRTIDLRTRPGSRGEVCERLKQSVLKTDIPERVSGVRIPPSPPACSGSLDCARDFACRLPLSRCAGSLTPAKRLNLKTDIALSARPLPSLLWSRRIRAKKG